MAVSDHSPEAAEQRAADLQRSRDIAASIDHGELFRSAMAPDPEPTPQQAPPPPTPTPQQPEPTPQQVQPAPAVPQERQRDEHGRFLPNTPDVQAPVAAPAAATQQQPPAQPVTPEEAMIPSWRLREERERREEVAQQLAQERQARMMWEQQMLQQRQAAQEQQQPVPDMVTDPQGYHAYMQNSFAKALRDHEANVSFRLQHMVHGEEFMAVYNDMLGKAYRGDPSMVREVMASPDPGARMMELHREARQKATLGQHEPAAWATQVWLPAAIKDPQARAQIAQMLQAATAPAAAPQATNGQTPQATYQVPPSLSRVPGAAANGPGGDMSDASLFAFAMRGR